MTCPVFCEVYYVQSDKELWTSFDNKIDAHQWITNFTKKWCPNHMFDIKESNPNITTNTFRISMYTAQPSKKTVSPEDIYSDKYSYMNKTRKERELIREQTLKDVRVWWSEIDNH